MTRSLLSLLLLLPAAAWTARQRVPTENGPLRLRGLGDFVTVLGGGYFFMPGRGAVRLLIGGV